MKKAVDKLVSEEKKESPSERKAVVLHDESGENDEESCDIPDAFVNDRNVD